MPATHVKDGADTRTRILHAATEQFARRGYAGTGLKLIAAQAQAPFGSIYHFFPGGKEELAREMLGTSGPAYLRLVLAVLGEPDGPQAAVAAVRRSYVVAGAGLEASGYQDACPIATMALDVASTSEPLRQACAVVFAEWLEAAAGWFGRFVEDRQVCRELAQSFVMLIEGAFLLARVTRSTEPLATAGDAMAALLQQRL